MKWQQFLVIAASLAAAPEAMAFSQGSPICEVLQLPLVEMSPTLAQPPPSGWRLESSQAAYADGQTLILRIVHDQPRSVRGVLLWAKQGPQQGSGAFALTPKGSWQHLPASANCGTWALTHRDATPKPQTELLFRWTAGDAAQSLFRAFLIEDCGAADCRAHQALTSILVLEGVLHRDGFEQVVTHSSTGDWSTTKSEKQKGGSRRPSRTNTDQQTQRQASAGSTATGSTLRSTSSM